MFLKLANKKLNPRRIPNLQIWYDAMKVNLLNDDVLTTWNDLSGNRYDASQSDLSKRPKFKSSDSNFGGRPSLLFDGNDDYLLISSSANGVSKNISGSTVFIVKNITTTNVSAFSFAIDNGTTVNFSRMTFRKNNTTAQITGRILDVDGQASRVGATSLSTTKPNIVHGRFDYAGTTPRILLYINNVADGTANLTLASKGNTSNTDPINGMTIGCATNLSSFMSGYIGEFIFYNRLLNIEESNLIYNYLKSKWGL